jgi:hypothetical protein
MDTQIQMQQAAEEVVHLFNSNLPSVRYIFKSGEAAVFVNGVYTTNDPEKIAELTTECKRGHPNLFIDQKRVTVSMDELNPMAVLRKKIREELLAEQAAARDMGNSIAKPGTGQVNTAGIAGIAASSIKVASAASK